MIIACATDRKFAPNAGVLLRSIALKGCVSEARVVLVGDRLTRRAVERLHICARGLDFQYIDLDTARQSIDGLPVSYYSAAIHIRLLLPQIIPNGSRLLYLDSDIVVNGSLRPLLDFPLNGLPVGAVLDPAHPELLMGMNRRIGRSETALYFNSGVLLMDLDAWRRERLGERCIDFIRSRPDLLWPDQDALNRVLDGRILPLERTWNFWSEAWPLMESRDFAGANVIHFAGPKRSGVNAAHPMFPLYLEVRATTPWFDYPVQRRSHFVRVRDLLSGRTLKRHLKALSQPEADSIAAE